MTREHELVTARRVVTGLDASGRSVIVSDEVADTRVVTTAFTINGVWQVAGLPCATSAGNAAAEEISLDPPAGGFNYFITSFPPDSEYDIRAAYADALAASGGADAALPDDGGIAGLHATGTVDIVTVISGEMSALVEDGETLLRPGDTLVQRGTKHAWRNRTDAPCTVVAVMMSTVE